MALERYLQVWHSLVTFRLADIMLQSASQHILIASNIFKHSSHLFNTYFGVLVINSNGTCLTNTYVSLRLRVQNAVPAQPCVGKY